MNNNPFPMHNILTKFGLSLFLYLLFSSQLHSQISRGGIPKSFRLGLTGDIVERVNMPSVDVEALSLEDVDRAQSNLPYRFAQAFTVDYNLNNSGTWTELANGDRLWRLMITCKDAKSINFLYDQFIIPKGGLVHLEITITEPQGSLQRALLIAQA